MSISAELQNSGTIDRNISLGIESQPMNSRLARNLNISIDNGTIVVGVQPNSAAQNAGIKIADVIVSANGIRVNSMYDIFDVIRTNDLRPGDKIRLRVFSDNKYKNVIFKLGHRS